MSIDATWPDGIDGTTCYSGNCRDILTRTSGSPPEILAEAKLEVVCEGREIRSISATPAPARLQELVGVRAGGKLRDALSSALREEKQAGAPLYLLLDDLAGATLVSKWSFSQWPDANPAHTKASVPPRNMEGICIGFRPGSSALDFDGRVRPTQNISRVVPLANPHDPLGWHAFENHRGINFRRARRIDLWPEAEGLRVESHFQDSASAPDGGDRIAIHEYLLEAQIDAREILEKITARPGTLPFPECRAAPINLSSLIGAKTHELREIVPEKLNFTHGCTHLNDVARSLAEVPALAEALSG